MIEVLHEIVPIEARAVRMAAVGLETRVIPTEALYDLKEIIHADLLLLGHKQLGYRNSFVQSEELGLDLLVGDIPHHIHEDVMKSLNSFESFPTMIGFVANDLVVYACKIQNSVHTFGCLNPLPNFRHTTLIRRTIVLPAFDGKLIEDLGRHPIDNVSALNVQRDFVGCQQIAKQCH
jgi:hypothetical protein